jgi:capsular exopolysaccharide synthesis family protein
MESRDNESAVNPRGPRQDASNTVPEDILHFYRGLLGQIEMLLPRVESKTILLTSSLPMEGTTEVTVGLGLCLAAGMGRKTAIVDCNPYHPDIHTRFSAEGIGVSEYLAGEIDLAQAMVNTIVPNLHIMPLGRRMTSLSGHSSEQLRNLISCLRDRFEYVLVDCAPIGVHAESTALCSKVDGVIVVIRHGSTRREIVKRTTEIVERAGGRVVGAVLNKRRFPIPEFLYRRL